MRRRIRYRPMAEHRCEHSFSLSQEGLITCLGCGLEREPSNALELAVVAFQDFGRLIGTTFGRPI